MKRTRKSKVVYELARVTSRVGNDDFQHVVVDGKEIFAAPYKKAHHIITDFTSEEELDKVNMGTPYSVVYSIFSPLNSPFDRSGTSQYVEEQIIYPFVSLKGAKGRAKELEGSWGYDILGDVRIVANKSLTDDISITKEIGKRIAWLATHRWEDQRDVNEITKDIHTYAKVLSNMGYEDDADHAIYIAELMEEIEHGKERGKGKMTAKEELEHAVKDFEELISCIGRE